MSFHRDAALFRRNRPGATARVEPAREVTDMPKRLPVYKISEIPRENQLHEGRMTRYGIRTKHALIVFADITPQPPGKQGYHRRSHDHPYDMLVVVTKGTLMMDVDGVEYELRAGSAMVVPAFAMHKGYAVEPVSLIEVFAPVRRDYIHLVDYQKEEFGDRGEPWIKDDIKSWNPPMD
jgi:mannose-6-phosphate isomerase-like protein (cupin superfamily)